MTRKNILLIGPASSGKSALGNLLINKNDNFEDIFKEGYRTRETGNKEVEEEGINYRIIDTVSWNWSSDENKQKILTELVQNLRVPERKIDQILLVMRGRGDWNCVITGFNLLKELDSELLEYITIVRSNFVGFKNQTKWQEDLEILRDPNKVDPRIAEIVNRIKCIYVNNPEIVFQITREEYPDKTEEEFERLKEREEIREVTNKEARKASRQRIFDHLKAACQGSYHVDLDAKISNFSNVEPKKTTATETRNILLIGSSGSGKSTLGNVLVNRNDNFTEVFESSASAVVTTRAFQKEEVEIEGIKYQIIDTVSWDLDWNYTSMNKQKVVAETIKAFQATEGKINRILLLIGKRGEQDHLITVFNLLRKLDPGFSNYTSIVITNFSWFEIPKECENEVKKLKDPEGENKSFAEIVAPLPVVFVDNREIIEKLIRKEENESEECFRKREKRNEEKREFAEEEIRLSRQKILDHLKEHPEIHRLEMENLKEKINVFFGIVSESEEESDEKSTAETVIDNDESVPGESEGVETHRKTETRTESGETERTEETNEGRENNGLGLKSVLTFSFFAAIVVTIVVVGYRWLTDKKKELSRK
jgi:guanylate kinase